MNKSKETRAINKEIARLKNVFRDIPIDKQELNEGLFVQAARLRVRLDSLWEDIMENGESELFTQSNKTDPYERERPSSRQFTATDKNYQTVMRQLSDLLPKGITNDKETEKLLDFIKN